MTFRLAGVIAGGAAATIGLGLLAAAPAHAAANPPVTVTVTSPGHSHTSPSPNATKIMAFYPTNTLEAICVVQGDYVNGSNQWLRVSNKGGGFISRSLVSSAPLPACR